MVRELPPVGNHKCISGGDQTFFVRDPLRIYFLPLRIDLHKKKLVFLIIDYLPKIINKHVRINNKTKMYFTIHF